MDFVAEYSLLYGRSNNIRFFDKKHAGLFESLLLTCKLQKSVPTKYGAKAVLCFALVHPVVGDHAGIGDN